MGTRHIQEKKFSEFVGFSFYNRALKLGHDYLKKAMDRHVFPHEGAIADLDYFDEPFPESS